MIAAVACYGSASDICELPDAMMDAMMI